MADLILKTRRADPLDRVYETDMAEGLKAMALEGHGIAFLPYSAVKKELRERKLVKATPPGMTGLELLMDVRAYRGKPSTKEASKGPAQALWAFLEAQSAAA
jgi:DNA-binding transcriptional LysR family regulator